jgi:membrane associated rhomboid family serine protease
MIPLTDASRRPVNFPVVTLALILTNFVVFLLELVGGEPFILRWALVPADIVAGHNWQTLLSSMFMHAGLEHILGNMVFLWAFGPEVEDAMGRGRYLAFYLLGGLAATAAQIAADPTSTVPNLGASGAIAAVMGAFLVTYPRDQIKSLLFIGWFGFVRFIPAVVFIGLWFVLQIFSQVGALSGARSDGVAYAAHIGGLLFGVLTARLFEGGKRPVGAEVTA